jgi:hypothetical protein
MEEAHDWFERRRHRAERLLGFAGLSEDDALEIAAGSMLDFFHLRDTPMGKQVIAQGGSHGR